jgi:hypothetical protein
MDAEPAATPLSVPLESTDATAGFDEVHAPTVGKPYVFPPTYVTDAPTWST